MVDLDTPPPNVPVPAGFPPYAGRPHTLRIHLDDGTVLEGHRAPVETFNPEQAGWPEVAAKFEDCVAFAGWLAPDKALDLRERLRSGDGSVPALLALLARED